MKLPSRRRRPQARTRLALTGDFHDDGRDITEAIQAVPPAPWDGTTVPLTALRGQPHYHPAPVTEPGNPPGSGYHSGVGPGNVVWHPGEYPPAAVLPMPQARAVMTVYPPAPGVPAPTPEALNVVRYLRDRVTILRSRGQLDRISDEKLAMLPVLPRRATARVIVGEAAELLRCGGDPR